jgi:hypothetical protein
MLTDLLATLQASDPATALRKSFWVYPLVNAGHIFGLSLLFGAILPLDLRLIGLWRDIDWRRLARVLVPVAGSGIVLALVTGVALFSSRPLDYAFEPLFQIKLALLTIAIGNALLLRRAPAWADAPATGIVPLRLRFSAVLSILCWIAVITLGRLVGYY